MAVHTMKVKVLDSTSSFIGIKYINSNSKSRMKIADFVRDYNRGILTVLNPDALENIKGLNTSEDEENE